MRANRLTLFLTAVLCLCTAAGAFAQNGQTPVTVIGQNGQAVPDATVTAIVNGTAQTAPGDGHSTFFVQGYNTKAELLIEHPSFGSRHLNVTLPGQDEGGLAVYIENPGAIAKPLDHSAVKDFFVEGTAGPNPIVPPPGNGCQLPDQLGHGGSGVLLATSDTAAGYICSECFCPTEDGYLTHAVWWGGYYDFGFGVDCGPGSGDSFTINYYLDSGTGAPGALIGSFPVSLAQKFMTGNTYIGILNEWQFQSSFHTPVPVSAGQCYWIEIFNSSPGGTCYWLWGTAPPGDNRSYQTGTGATDYDLAFCTNLLIANDGCGVPAGPPNDDCADCDIISGEGTFAFDSTNATMDGPGHTLCDFFGQNSIDHDLWWCWTAPCDATVTIQTCGFTSVDTKLAVYDSTSCPPTDAALLACNDDACGLQSLTTFSATSGSTYLLRVGTYPGAAGGAGSFSLTCGGGGGGPANDACADAESVSIGSVTSGSTLGAAADGLPFCGTSEGTGGTVWYSVIGNGNRLAASFCQGGGSASYDTKLHVYCGGCAGLICVGGNDDTCSLLSEVQWDTSSGVEYLIAVHGFSSASGTFDLAVVDLGANQGTPVACSAPLTGGMDIGSNVAGVFIQVSPADLYMNGAGLTPFSRFFNPDTMVTVTAPMEWNGQQLMGWLVNDRVVRPHNGTLTGTIEGTHKVKAIYNDGGTAPSGGVFHR